MATATATATATLSKIERAHQMYRDGLHEEALGFYTEALAMAKTKAQKIALHSNRAACYLKLQDFKKAGEECTSVLELDHEHTGALMLRAQTLVTLKEYRSAFFDVNRLVELNPSSEVYQNLQAQLRTQLSLAPIPESEEEALATDLEEEENGKNTSDVHSKGWQTISKPQGHSRLDYSRWDRVEDDSSEEDDDDDEEQEQPQYRFRVRTVGVRPVK
ncbi:hypothetical protein QJS04_geneDACA018849 [Acorus gramineus]|uniref:Uncharacterized protein n=1 Tax=Acorus gramineus TaxID=55184 RepID=A0AAV9BVN6_ACOGR|nr:hypothetical protein QJS04_geneDACA018849 [Acorus gramineus]